MISVLRSSLPAITCKSASRICASGSSLAVSLLARRSFSQLTATAQQHLRPQHVPSATTSLRPNNSGSGFTASTAQRIWSRQNSTASDAGSAKDDGGFAKSSRAEAASQVNLTARLSRPGEIQTTASSNELMRLFRLAKRERKSLALAFTMLIISSLISLSLPAVIGKILDAINSEGDDKQIWGIPLNQFFLGVGFFFILGSTANYMKYVLLRIIGERIVSRLRINLFKKTVQQDAEFFDANRVGDLISRLSTDASIVSKSVTQSIADGLKSSLTCVMGVSMMAYTSLKLTSAIIIIIPPVLLGTWWYGRKIRQLSRSFQEALGNMTKVSEERLSNVKVSQSFAAESQEIGLYTSKIRGVLAIALKDAQATASFQASMHLIGNLTILALLGIGSGMVSTGALSFGQLTSFVMYTAYTGGAAAGIGSFYGEIMKGTGAASRLFELLDRNPKIHPTIGAPLEDPKGVIEFDHVEFSYPTRPAVKIFSDINFKIEPGSNVCIVGPSGGGKSTITSLILRFYDPIKGFIKIGGQDLKSVNLRNLRRHIGVVSQEPVLFSGTIAENIKYGLPSASRAQVIDAAKKANCSFLSDFPKGLDTKVGPRGAQLSGGQKQRIAIARALIKNPSILILDEATSALDSESERLVNEALHRLMEEGNATVISIAHRLSTIRRSDQIIVLGPGGVVVEEGKFFDLYYDSESELSKLLKAKDQDDMVPPKQQSPEIYHQSQADLDADVELIEEHLEHEEIPEQESEELRKQFR